MDKAHRDQLAADFHSTVTSTGDAVLAAHDRIQHWAKTRPEFVARCKFGRSMQVRRLKNVQPKHWNPTDWAGAEAVLVEIENLRKTAHDPACVLALAVLGVETDDLPAVLALLESKPVDDAAPVAADTKPRPPERQSGQKRTK